MRLLARPAQLATNHQNLVLAVIQPLFQLDHVLLEISRGILSTRRKLQTWQLVFNLQDSTM